MPFSSRLPPPPTSLRRLRSRSFRRPSRRLRPLLLPSRRSGSFSRVGSVSRLRLPVGPERPASGTTSSIRSPPRPPLGRLRDRSSWGPAGPIGGRFAGVGDGASMVLDGRLAPLPRTGGVFPPRSPPPPPDCWSILFRPAKRLSPRPRSPPKPCPGCPDCPDCAEGPRGGCCGPNPRGPEGAAAGAAGSLTRFLRRSG